ncbi:VWA domain-containing protein [Gordonia alkaliphila]|uniref:MadC family VWA domain-containing protein n=1 Tax=Gordonia alkaliphila TaxID=1053547 RepID=UPI001FF5F54A|nr:VWA domain-containing protein [Gordonia alkaliphila]MCK0440148.1 VWA domain-containing protein [Gordonia alkaliphila]
MLAAHDVQTGPDRLLVRLAVEFGRVLRLFSVQASPAEVIEICRVLDLVGGADLEQLRTALRAVTVKYGYERDGFEEAFALFFLGHHADAEDDELPRVRGLLSGLPDDIDWDEEFSGGGRMIGADEHTVEIGDLMADDPDARERNAQSAHREENDFSVSGGAEQLQVDTENSSVSGGVTYTVEVEHADASQVGELTAAATRVEGTTLNLADAAALLRALDASDGRHAYGVDGAAGLDAAAIAELEEALTRFVEALTDRLAGAAVLSTVDDPPTRVHRDQADIDRACHRLVQRMRGAPRRVSRLTTAGRLDFRRTMRAAVATDGVPLELWRRRTTPGPVRLLVLVDVSISVRPVTGFILRLAQTLHKFGDRCEVVAFVDRPVRVTPALRSASPDGALAAVLAADGLDLSATSDYGRMWHELLDEYGDLITSRTSVLVVGDARHNAFDPRTDLFDEVARRAYRVAWLTPEPERYWSQTGCALGDYAEQCAAVVSARDGAEVLERCDELGAALR